jgi:hypothetical protein
MQDLPATVRDAILVAESLGIVKIWIDAFCILQDDPLDKAWEISQMLLIYNQATLTIAASRANQVDEGFLQNRKKLAEDNPNLVFELPFRYSNSQLGSVMLVPEVVPSTEPLDKRAWALQERFLSSRILEYGSLQTRWICQHTTSSTIPTDGYKALIVSSQERNDNLFVRALKAVIQASNLRGLRYYWYDLVNVYTHRVLTLEADRLPVISGIAARIGKILDDEYKAGLWKSKMASELPWRVDIFSEDRRSRHREYEVPSWSWGNHRPQPLEYQAPSWSWASLDFPTRLPLEREMERDQCGGNEILDCQIDLQTANANFSAYDTSFGTVKSGRLKVGGRLQLAE